MNACGCVTGPPLGGKCACGAVCPTLCRQGTTTPTTVIHDLVTKILDDVQPLSPLAATKALLAASAKAAPDLDLPTLFRGAPSHSAAALLTALNRAGFGLIKIKEVAASAGSWDGEANDPS